MKYDFETVIDRSGTGSLKWDGVRNAPGKDPVLPLWVADMDFPVLPEVQKALADRVAHPIYGYMKVPSTYLEAVCAWHQSRYQRTITPDQLIPAPSVMHALSMAVRAFTEKGDRILVLPPVYYPFFKVVTHNGRELVEAPLKRQGVRWSLDEGAITDTFIRCEREGRPIRAVLFCAPQNPTGRVWTAGELDFWDHLAERYPFTLLSDEIHADIVLPPHRHISLFDRPGLADRTLVITGPNKTFNLAGLHICHVMTRDENLRRTMKHAVETDFYDEPNIMSLTAALAAYTHGSAWVDQLITVIAQNYTILKDRLVHLDPQILLAPLEGTYLAWADMSTLIAAKGFQSDKDLSLYLEDEGRVKISAGSIFRTGGENHLRFNLAAPAQLLKEGLDRMENCLSLHSAHGKI